LPEGFCVYSLATFLRFLILAQSHNLAMAKVAFRRPFDELEVPHELRLAGLAHTLPLWSAHDAQSIGLFQSTDGGGSWTQISTSTNGGYTWTESQFSLTSPGCCYWVSAVAIDPQSHNLAMAKVAFRRPFDELEVPHELRLEPPTFHHFRGRQTCAPTTSLFLGQICEGAFLDFQRLHLLEQFRSRCGREATAVPGGIDQAVAFVVRDDQCIEILERRRVSGDNELPSLIDAHFPPSTGA
jgi:hypothetical protein